jgi:translation initiation factor 1 (eIF-1/SUI1)
MSVPDSVRYRGKVYRIVRGFRSSKAKADEYAKSLRTPGKSGSVVKEFDGMCFVYFR